MPDAAIRRPVDVSDIDAQRDKGWPDFHPEDYCHRCGGPNIVWHVDSGLWNRVMRDDNPGNPEPWQGIICPPCFVALFGSGVWELRLSGGVR